MITLYTLSRMEKVRGDQLNVEVINAPREAWGGSGGGAEAVEGGAGSTTQQPVVVSAEQVEADEEPR